MKLSDIFHQNQILINKLFPESLKEVIDFSKNNKSITGPFGNDYLQVTGSKKIKSFSYLTWQFARSPLSHFSTSPVRQISSSPLHPYSLFGDFYFKEFYFTDLATKDSKGSEVKEITRIQIDEAANIKQIIKDVCKNHKILYSISSREFEKMIAEILRSHGFHVELTKQTRDNGYDMLAIRSINNHQPLKYLVECKRYSPNNKVGVEIIRSFKDVIVTEQANAGILVTTSHFSKDARFKKEKEVPHILELKDKDDVIAWVNGYAATK